ncbi:hypothetical protein HDU98_006129 [Podochytrium sp. JEL0797]|nr:hypothetical protein HDU98_006129 [Podochytrium sp. JEL0797]
MGWLGAKDRFFEKMHREGGHGVYHEKFGWQETVGIPKCSLIVFLDGTAMDMSAFELELLSVTWAYVTIVLVGYEGCVHHHAHAIELERVAELNPHVGVVAVQGRVCERFVVDQVLKLGYPLDPPTYQEIADVEASLNQVIDSNQ